MIRRMVDRHGIKKWAVISQHLPGWTGKQCRERWHNHLAPGINRDGWREEEDRIIIQFHKEQGSCWSAMAKALQGRTDNAIKNRWNSTLRKVKRQEESGQGTHKPSRRGEDNGILYEYICSTLSIKPRISDPASSSNSSTPAKETSSAPVPKSTPSKKRARTPVVAVIDDALNPLPRLPTLFSPEANSPATLDNTNYPMVDIDTPRSSSAGSASSPASSVSSSSSDNWTSNSGLAPEQIKQLMFMLPQTTRATLEPSLQALYQMNKMMLVG